MRNVLAGPTMQTSFGFRRRVLRVEAGEDLYAFWSCDGRDGLSHVRDLSLGGLFIQSPVEEDLGAPVKLYLLTGAGQIRANAVVRHVRPSRGLGLEFTAIDKRDCQRLGDLIECFGTTPKVCGACVAG